MSGCYSKSPPAVTGQDVLSDSLRNLIVLPSCLGGLGITSRIKQAENQHETSLSIRAPLIRRIVEQSAELPAVLVSSDSFISYNVGSVSCEL